MKFLLLKTLLLQKRKDEGFTLPMVIAIGLVMVLLSAVNLVQSGEENLMAISQEGSSDALAMAEIGVARYRDFLNRNRVLAVNNLNQWVGLDNETCDVISEDGQGWANDDNDGGSSGYNAAMWREIEVNDESSIGTSGLDFNGDGDTTDTNAEIGRYKIVDYIYDNDGDPTTNENGAINLVDDAINSVDGFPPRGILTVQGRDRIGSVAQLQVTIPLGVNTQDLEDLNPAIWVQQSTITNFGNNVDVNGSNVVLKRPSGLGGCDNPPDINSQNTISDPRNLPSLVTVPNPSGLIKSNDLYSPISNIQNDPRYDSGTETIILGRLSDAQNTSEGSHVGDDRYYFEVSGNLDLADGQSIISDGTARVIIYVSGNLTISGDVDITNSSDAAQSRFLEIHVGGNVTIQGNGEVNIKGLIHAPDGTVTMTGTGDVNVTGSIFADDWNNTRNGTVSITTDDYRFYSITPNRTPKPVTYRPSGWERQEAKQF